MPGATDRLVEAAYSPQADAYKRRSMRAIVVATIAGFVAVGCFAVCAVAVMLSIAGLNPLPGAVTFLFVALFGAVVVVLIPVSMGFAIRGIYLGLSMLRHINRQMATQAPNG